MEWLHDFRQANSGDIVRIEALDWTMYNEQVSRDDNFKLTRAVIIGEIVKPTPFREGIVIAPQLFEDETIRCSLVVSYATIINMCRLASSGDIELSRTEFFESNAKLSDELAYSKSGEK